MLLQVGRAQVGGVVGPIECDPQAVHTDRLCVKLVEGSGAQWRDGKLVSRTGMDLTSVAAIFAQAMLRPLVYSVSWEELDAWHRHACAVLPSHNRPGHLGLWFHLTGATAASTANLRDQLLSNALIAHVHHEPRYVPASAAVPPGGDIPPTTPLFTSLQLTHNLSPQGHGVRRSSGVFGARGQDIKFVMLEQSFVLGHEDVCQLVASNFIGTVPALDMQYAQHGLAGAAMVCGDRNAYGFTGIADEVTARFLGLTQAGGFENGLAIAVSQTQPADLIMVVIIIQVPSLGLGTWVPVEYFQSSFDATLTATALGRQVVVPGGNGNLSLDDPALLNRFDRNFRDSGAVMVAASAAGALQRASFSNWGSRIDAHSWGDQVASCGYGTTFFPNFDILQSYSAGVAGTSASTPQLAGLVASIQGAAKKQLGQALTNQQLLAALHTYGPTTPDIIGRRPDLVAMFEGLGIIDGLMVDTPDLALTATMTVTMAGAPGSLAALFASFAAGDFDLGFNRHVHLDLLSLVSLGAFVLPTGTASWSLAVPNNASLHGADLYFQAVRLTGASPLHVTNSCQVTIL